MSLLKSGKMKNKKAFEIGFSWLFAIIAGSIILLLAIYGVSRLIQEEKYVQYTESAKKINILLDPMETGIAGGKAGRIDFRTETRTFYGCSLSGKNIFGKNTISFSEKSGIGEKWAEPGGEISIYNKYIFANQTEEGKELYLFSKPFFLPFKVADLIFVSSNEFCFKNTPESVVEEIEGLGIKNIHLENCSENDIKVCFGGGKCEILVQGFCIGYGCESQYSYGKVYKDNKVVYYAESLLYGAIVSSSEVYECNVKRLMIKTAQLSYIYKDKINFIEKKSCHSNIEPELNTMINLANSFTSSSQLFEAYQISKEINSKNQNNALCKVYEV